MSVPAPDTEFEILLVEDNPGDVRLLREGLSEARARHRLRVAGDGREALDLLDGLRSSGAGLPDLVLLDLNLPGMSGREVLAALKSDVALRRIPVVVLTSSEDGGDISEVYDLGANAFVTKPLDLDDHVRVVRTIEQFWFRTAWLPTRSAA